MDPRDQLVVLCCVFWLAGALTATIDWWSQSKRPLK